MRPPHPLLTTHVPSTRIHHVLGSITVRMGTQGGTVASGIVRGAIVARGNMHFVLRWCLRRRGGPRYWVAKS